MYRALSRRRLEERVFLEGPHKRRSELVRTIKIAAAVALVVRAPLTR